MGSRRPWGRALGGPAAARAWSVYVGAGFVGSGAGPADVGVGRPLVCPRAPGLCWQLRGPACRGMGAVLCPGWGPRISACWPGSGGTRRNRTASRTAGPGVGGAAWRASSLHCGCGPGGRGWGATGPAETGPWLGLGEHPLEAGEGVDQDVCVWLHLQALPASEVLAKRGEGLSLRAWPGQGQGAGPAALVWRDEKESESAAGSWSGAWVWSCPSPELSASGSSDTATPAPETEKYSCYRHTSAAHTHGRAHMHIDAIYLGPACTITTAQIFEIGRDLWICERPGFKTHLGLMQFSLITLVS